ncbi:hypothetical protein Hc94105_1641 [Helicobacter cinaedi]|uniref:hypothetical protein n=1 Tax=Helicobacter cinaedi TaxID=213 RepID=UPI001F413E6E|nr:hypothetical protein [Helicobacter cinaedi]BDB67418.1 hypothetical protein Hc94105_1641 [Helicobacter cinaedi]
MRKTIFGLMISTMCVFGLESEEVLEAMTNGIMMGICGGGEEIATQIRIAKGIDTEKAIDIERLKMCGKVTLEKPLANRKYSKSKKEEWSAIYEEGMKVGKEVFHDLMEELTNKN